MLWIFHPQGCSVGVLELIESFVADLITDELKSGFLEILLLTSLFRLYCYLIDGRFSLFILCHDYIFFCCFRFRGVYIIDVTDVTLFLKI